MSYGYIYIPSFTHVMSVVSYFTVWKHLKTRGFLMFSGGIDRDQSHEMSSIQRRLSTILKTSKKSVSNNVFWYIKVQKQPSRCALRKRCSENIRQIYRIHPCKSVISIKLQSNFIKIALWHGCCSVNLLHFFRIPIYKNTSGGLLLKVCLFWKFIHYTIHCDKTPINVTKNLFSFACFN